MNARAGLFLAFAGLGATASVIPASLPAAEHALGASLLPAVPALFAGLLVGVLASPPLLVRAPATRVAATGSAVQAVALATVAIAPSADVLISATAVAGIGFGFTEAAGSVAAKAHARGSTAGVLGALTGTVAATAAVVPLLVAFAVGSRLTGVVLLAAAAVQASAALALIRMSADGVAATADGPRRPRVRLVRLVPFGVALALYVGVETVFAGWSAVIPADLLELDPAAAALGTSGFWALMAVGRFVSAWRSRHGTRATVALVVGSGSSTILLVAAATASDGLPWLSLAAVGAAVVALSPTYALLIGVALDRLDDAEAAAVTGALVASGAVGGALVPSFVLLIGRDPASAETLLITALLCAVVCALAGTAIRARRPVPIGGSPA